MRSALLAAQQLAEADPAGWRIGWRAWPARMRENQWESARFRRAAWLEAVGPRVHLVEKERLPCSSSAFSSSI
jgi:hypothetical protein